MLRLLISWRLEKTAQWKEAVFLIVFHSDKYPSNCYCYSMDNKTVPLSKYMTAVRSVTYFKSKLKKEKELVVLLKSENLKLMQRAVRDQDRILELETKDSFDGVDGNLMKNW